MFYLIEGAIQVMVHEAKFYLAAGGMFMVPRGMSLVQCESRITYLNPR
jgi:mannose-6-phosphate isomerase-like protein (cupin superfamily)